MSDPMAAAPAAGPSKTAVDLEWPRLLQALATRCQSEAARLRVEQLEPADGLAEAQDRMALTEQALAAAGEGEPVPSRAVPQLEELLERFERRGLASALELRDVAAVLTAARQLRPYATAQRSRRAALGAALGSDGRLDGLLEAIDTCIDPTGRIHSHASAVLAAARARVRDLRRALLERLAALIAHHADVLRDRQYVEREGRYALPVRADAHRRVEGILLGASASGATLYVEPRQITELGNRLKMAESEVEREQARILAELSAQVGAETAALAEAYEACVTADVLGAWTSWAEQTRSIAIRPEPDAGLDLRAIRHPLLLLREQEVVPNDIALEPSSALVISGPNAGGKTVALKCLGLACWMARAGIPLPVAPGSRIGWFGQVLTDLGDEQSIERSLSTFSAEVDNLRRIIAASDHRTLVLLDEVAGSTDPEEGSALAAAVLESLVARGAAVVATTHYERLKELAASSDRFTNASVGFDFEAMQPTFRLTTGTPGASSALLVAARHGLPATIVERAKQLLARSAVDRQQLLVELERQRQALAQAQAAAARDAERAQALVREIEQERRTARKQERRRLAGEAEELTQAVRDARARLRSLLAGLGAGAAAAEVRRADRAVDDAARVVAIGSPLSQAAHGPEPTGGAGPLAASELVPGTRVYVPKLGAIAEIEAAPERDHVRVRIGPLGARVAVAELERAAAAPSSAPKSSRPVARPRPPTRPSSDPLLESPLRTSTNTCDLRGQRVDEALAELDSFVDRCLRADEPAGFVLHGHGTGALKRAVREHLAAASHVADVRAAERDQGGDAFTVFWLRG